jgi:hypothetical protein
MNVTTHLYRASRLKCVESYLHFSIRLNGVVFGLNAGATLRMIFVLGFGIDGCRFGCEAHAAFCPVGTGSSVLG